MSGVGESSEPTYESDYIPPPATSATNIHNHTPEEEAHLRKLSSSRKSDVWKHYTTFYGPHPRTGARASPKDGTSHLADHVTSCAKKRRRDSGQPTLSQDDSGNILAFTYSQSVARRRLIKWIIKRELPFNVIEELEFASMIKESFCPQFVAFSRHTVRSDIVKVFKEEKTKLKEVLLAFDRKICLTSDLWTSNQNLGYCSITAHYVDKYWKLQKRIVSFCNIDSPHTGDAISTFIIDKLNKLGIFEKIFSISLDNASSNTVAFSILKTILPGLPLNGRLSHVRCCCHVLNLIVKDGLSDDGFKEPIHRIKENLGFIFGSTQRYQHFRDACTNAGLPPKRLPVDVKHRWNSTYEMLNEALPYYNVIKSYLKDKACPEVVLDSDWLLANMLRDFLHVFVEATEYFSGVYYTTSNSVINHLYAISVIFQRYRHVQEFMGLVRSMEIKFLKYWGKTPTLFSIAYILDPRAKYAALDIIISGTKCVDTSESVHNEIFRLYDEYVVISQNNVVDTPTSSANNVATSSTSGYNSAWAFLQTQINNVSGSASNELQRYLSEPILTEFDKEFDVLSWWRANKQRFPILSMMARDVLAVPVSTVASESAFSAGRRVLSDYRSRLVPPLVEASVCLKDWFEAEDRDIAIQKEEESIIGLEMEFLNLD
ncbi:hypothetical protein AQUCO_00700036v1 [Aquilegia coerulea]|uniref:HAT C-terminal dimerisation domain-containing protein n=1 Tax=Aquilegia coerulea TaxID=218851 RepID=A0A2G5EI75_AQUCA|nr:hypothetical protein AQUCO_00700036v1 [Aquilegia coerulea]